MSTTAHYKSRNELREEDVEREGYDMASPVECSREHEVITRMLLQLQRGICGKYFPGQPLHHQLDLAGLLLDNAMRSAVEHAACSAIGQETKASLR
jgi:hypothetical protein